MSTVDASVSPSQGPTGSVPESTDSPSARRVRNLQLSRFNGLGILALLIIMFGIWIPDTFLTSTNFKGILASQAIVAVLALGLLLPLSAGAFDLSAAQNLGFGALLCGWLMTHGPMLSPVLAVPLTLIFGLVVGAVNGFLIVGVGIDSFIATLGTTSILLAAGDLLANGQYLGPFPASYDRLASGEILGIPTVVAYVLVLAVILWYVLEHSPIGRRVSATGANRDAARLAGIRVKRLVFGAMLASGLISAFAGVLLGATLGTVNETAGPTYLLPAFAAAFLGATQLKPGRFNVWGTLLAIRLLGVGVQGFQLVGGQVWLTELFNGLALLVAVGSVQLVDRFRSGRSSRRVVLQRRLQRSEARSAGVGATKPDAGSGRGTNEP